jgi:hypothetical protein
MLIRTELVSNYVTLIIYLAVHKKAVKCLVQRLAWQNRRKVFYLASLGRLTAILSQPYVPSGTARFARKFFL